jgi:hypothetical protein
MGLLSPQETEEAPKAGMVLQPKAGAAAGRKAGEGKNYPASRNRVIITRRFRGAAPFQG